MWCKSGRALFLFLKSSLPNSSTSRSPSRSLLKGLLSRQISNISLSLSRRDVLSLETTSLEAASLYLSLNDSLSLELISVETSSVETTSLETTSMCVRACVRVCVCVLLLLLLYLLLLLLSVIIPNILLFGQIGVVGSLLWESLPIELLVELVTPREKTFVLIIDGYVISRLFLQCPREAVGEGLSRDQCMTAASRG